MSINVNAKRTVVNVWVFFLAMAGLMSCSSDELLTQHLSDDTVTFTSHVTRAQDDKWESGDQIGVYMVGGNPAPYLAENKFYTTTDGGANFVPSSSADALSWPKDGSPVKFQAYYPYSATAVTNGVYKIDISNQSKALDLMYAPADKAYTKADGKPALAFSHQMAQVTITLTSTDGKDLSDLNVTLQNVPTKVDYTFSTESGKSGSFGTSSENKDVTMYHVSGTGLTANDKAVFRAFLIPGDYKGGINLVLSNADGSKATKPAPLKESNAGAESQPLTTLSSGANYSFEIANVKGLGGTAANVPSEKVIFYMETPKLTDVQLKAENLVYKTYTFDKGRGEERNYSILFDKKKKMALWVAYPLNASYTGSGRDDKWQFDPDPKIGNENQINVPSGKGFEEQRPGSTLNLYDRGHQIPNGDRNGNDIAAQQTFYFTNLTPQIWSVNQQVWQKLETHVRNIAEGLGDDTLFVTTGPIFKGTAQATEKADGKKIDVPSAYFKVIAKVTRDASCRVTDAKTVGYIIPNELNLSTDYSKWIKSVAEVEKETGFILFPDIPQNYKEKATTTW